MTPERVADFDCRTGEGPIWHPDEGRLYWVDIPDGELYRYDPETGESELCYEGERIGAMTVQENGDLLLFMDRGAVRTWNGGIEATLFEEVPEEADSRFNDVIAGPGGRVYCGTRPEGSSRGRLYRLDRDGRLVTLIDDVPGANGMGFSPDRGRFYFTETHDEAVYGFEYDPETGDLSNRERVVDAVGGSGRPDGLTVDAEGYLWSARWNGGCLVRHSPDGRPVERVAFPARKVSSVAFGGPDYRSAYVTTAGGEGDPAIEGEGAGALYRVDLGVGGTPEFRSRIEV